MMISKLFRTLRSEGLQGVYRRLQRHVVFSRPYRAWFPYHLGAAYDRAFFEDNMIDSRPLAEYLAPRLASEFGIKTLVDLGAGSGCWVAAFNRAGVDAYGVEGSRAAAACLACDRSRIIFRDLRRPLSQHALPLRSADAVLSFEVAEHIEREYCEQYLDNVTAFRPRWILFTAAMPGQGGHWHVNEQPREYWIQKFEARGYNCDEEARQRIGQFCAEGRAEPNPSPELCHPLRKHKGVWIPAWMPRNLFMFRSAGT